MSITTSVEKGVAQITIQRSEKRNALDSMHCIELRTQIREADQNPEVHAIVLSGLTNVFTPGLDIAEMQTEPKPLFEAFQALIDQVRDADKPIIAAVNGPAVAQGVAILYYCDVVYCGEHSMFSLPNVALGLPPQYGVSMLAVREAGYKTAFRKLVSSEPISPTEAMEMGIVNNILDDDKVVPQAVATAVRIASMPPETVVETKRLLKWAYLKNVGKQEAAEHVIFEKLIDGPEHKEALSAFLENRKPDFSKK